MRSDTESQANSLEALPEELKSHVLSYLSSDPPSWNWQQHTPPTWFSSSSSLQPLKALSLVSKSWHRIVVPLLFSHLRLGLPEDPVPPVSLAGTEASVLTSEIQTIKSAFKQWLFRDTGFPLDIRLPYRHCWENTAPPKAAEWVHKLDTGLTALLSFLNDHDLCGGVESLTIAAAGELNDQGLNYIRDEVHCLIATAAFWVKIFKVLEPKRVTLIAATSTLACLLGSSINMQDSWAFPGMATQMVSLWGGSKENEGPSAFGHHYDALAPIELNVEPNVSGRPALASLLYIRPWTHLAVNEGSYLEAYSTYEYFHKEPAGILCPISRGFRLDTQIRSVAYKAVFPYSSHVIKSLEGMSIMAPDDGAPGTGARHLHLKLVPSPEDNVLDDPAQVGKADITDCWGEAEMIYVYFTGNSPAHRREGHLAELSSIRMFRSGDSTNSMIGELLAENLGDLGWETAEDGAWTIPEHVLTLRDTGRLL